MKNNTANTIEKLIRILLLLLCLGLLVGCAKSAGGNAGGGKSDGGNTGGGNTGGGNADGRSESAGYSAENAPFEEKTPEAINGKDEKSGQEAEAGSVDIASAVKEIKRLANGASVTLDFSLTILPSAFRANLLSGAIGYPSGAFVSWMI